MADPHDDLDTWMNAQVQPLPPPPGTFELIRKRARRRKVTRAVAAAAGAAAVIAVIATVPRLVITQLHVSPGPAQSGSVAGQTSPAGHHHHHHAAATPSAAPSTPTPTTAPAPLVPANFQATSVTFVGLNTGFVIGQAGTPGHCGPPRAYVCTSIAGTGDHGGTWHGVRAPVTGSPAGAAGVSQIRFHDTSNGWAFGPELWATHDGGLRWRQVNTHGLRVTALETAGDRVFAVWARCSGGGTDFAADCTSSTLYSAAVGSNHWAAVPGAGPRDSLSGSANSSALVLTGSRGYLLAPDGTLLSGPVTSAGAWQPATGTSSPAAAPCPPGTAQADGQPSGALLAATTSSGLALVCTSPAAGTTQAKAVWTSSDTGRTWRKAGEAAAAGTATSLAGTATGTIVLATTAGLQMSTDGGATWTAAQGARPAGGFSYVGMTDPQQGVAVPADPGQHAVWFTFDGGQSWQASPVH